MSRTYRPRKRAFSRRGSFELHRPHLRARHPTSSESKQPHSCQPRLNMALHEARPYAILNRAYLDVARKRETVLRDLCPARDIIPRFVGHDERISRPRLPWEGGNKEIRSRSFLLDDSLLFRSRDPPAVSATGKRRRSYRSRIILVFGIASSYLRIGIEILGILRPPFPNSIEI